MNKKAISTLTLIILIVASAIVGGIISYMLTIAYYVEIGYNVPENEITLVITEIFLDPKDVSSFSIEVLNPSYSVSDATITGIAVSIEDEDVLYNVIEASPDLKEGIPISVGESVKISCKKIQFKGKSVTLGRFITEYPGKVATVHVFSKEGSAANKKFILPSAELEITPEFDVSESVKNFTLTIRNEGQENLTINYIRVGNIELTKENTGINISQGISIPAGKTLALNCKEEWSFTRGNIVVSTLEGYEFVEEFTAPLLQMFIQDVSFNENNTSSFKVTLGVTAFQIHTGYINVTSTSLMLDNGTQLTFNQSLGVKYNSTATFEVPWDWTRYRGREINLTIETVQGLTATKKKIKTPDPVILKVLNKEKTFSLLDKEHFNVTIQNHQSSIEAVNITKIIIKETGEVISGTKSEPQLPWGPLNSTDVKSFYCNASSLAGYWRNHAGENITLVIHYVVTNGTEYTFSVTFALPIAELNITSVTLVHGATNYLNITVENLPCSMVNLTISRITVTFENQTVTAQMQITPGQIMILIGEKAFVLFPVKLEDSIGEVTVKVVTEEGIEAYWSGTPSF
ncbi:hypothetical protein J7K27_08130 [Candidatus Bathyarchaeota archaeon]|nr:hypothetical protein [Candidatus Bathyarchaeota archaeon]